MSEKKKSAMEVFNQQIQQVEEIDNDFFAKNSVDDTPMVQTAAPTISIPPNISYASGGASLLEEKKKEKKRVANISINQIKTSEELQLEKEPIKAKITGRCFWKRVVVPPNAYVVHTRINRKSPVTIGLGISFRYKPNKDAYLIVPAATQTIGVVANCISREKQGINILAYVQWQIDDFSKAYKKIDFSDTRDPLGIVNAQLREQAEAAIKDKIATMSVEEVLTDKALIIEELTLRLKKVAEGQAKDHKSTDEGLGIKIATVQIREAIVSSPSLWEDLQSPFRNEQKKKADISYLEMKNEIIEKELISRKERETREAETNLEIELTRQQKLTETLELKMREEATRFRKEQEMIQSKNKMEEQTILAQKEMQERLIKKENEMLQKRELEIMRQAEVKAIEEARIAADAEKLELNLEIERQLYQASEDARLKSATADIRMEQIALEKKLAESENDLAIMQQNFYDKIEKMRLEGDLTREEARKKMEFLLEEEKNKLDILYQEQQLKLDKIKQEIRNTINSNVIISQLVAELPEIASSMPEIKELKVFQTGQNEPVLDHLMSFLTKVFSLADSLGIHLPLKKSESKGE